MAEADEYAEQAADDDALTIGDLINVLKEEFPDVSVSKVRFLESQGLLAPGRSEGGYRLFEDHDVERLRFILRQQRDHYLPLKVIKSKLTMWERGEEPGEDEAPPRSRLIESGGEPITRSELLRRSGLSDEELASLVEHGLLEDAEVYPSTALTVGREARHLFGQGLEARHLRAIRHAAEREADVLAQLTAGLLRMRSAEAHDQARNLLETSGEAILSIHRALLARELRRMANDE